MQKNSITNKITPCCTLPFGNILWWVQNLKLNTEADRQFIISKISQCGTLSIDGWKALINSGELETDASLTKSEFLAWFDCDRQPSCPQLKLLIEGFKLGNYNPIDEYGIGWTIVSDFEIYNDKIIKKITGVVGGIGVVPQELQDLIGKYYAASGGFTTDKNLATDFKPEVEVKSLREVDPILKTGTVGNVDTYTIYYTDATTSTFTVTNGETTQLDVDGGALSFETAKMMLKGFMNSDTSVPINTVTIPASANLGGGHFLRPNNTYNNDGAYPNAGVVYNYPVGKASKFRVKNVFNLNPGALFAAVTGMKKDGTPAVLLTWTDPDVSGEHIFDVSDFTYVSVQTWAIQPFPILELIEYQTDYADVKRYIDDQNTVIDFFLHPFEVVETPLSMPRPNEAADNILNTQWAQYGAIGFGNGSILVADLPADAEKFVISGNFSTGGGGTLWLAGYNNTTGIYDQILKGVLGSGTQEVVINRAKYEGYLYTRQYNNQVFKTSKKVILEKKKDSVKEYIDNHVSSGSTISNEKKAQIKRPSKVLRIEFTTTDAIPVDKTTIASGTFLITDLEGLGLKKFGTMEVQGASSALYAKKNWTFALYNDEAKTDSFKLRLGNWAEHSEFVYKANWIDATHARNIVSNQIWEDIVQSRVGYPKRENEKAYIVSDTEQLGRFDSGALTHVDGVPCEFYLNGGFYGIGTFNLGKKRENYDLKSGTQNHIQLAAETHANFYAYNAAEWEIRNPKTPDANFTTKINAWFAANALTGQAFKDAFPINHDVNNAVDFFLLAEFIQSPDMYTKNLMLTSWNGTKFYFLPYDMDTTFGLQWDGASFTGWQGSIRSAGFWNKFYSVYTPEVKARYAELKAKGVFTIDNAYKHFDKMNKTFGVELYKKEQAAWSGIPSNSTIYTGFPQIYDWVKNRLIWLDSQYS